MALAKSWGGYPDAPQVLHPVAWRDALADEWRTVSSRHGSTLAFGNGRSYGDSCLAASGQVLQTLPMDRLISVDWDHGVLRAEAGMTLEQILAVAIPRGWMLEVTPGTKYVTLAGAVANDVHGKNHHVRGTFGRYVRRFALARSDGTVFECSSESNEAYFKATVGGLGLTGLIIWVEIQLKRVHSSVMNVKSTRFENLDEFFALSAALDPLHEYSVAWVDCLSRGEALGRGRFMTADHAQDGPLQVEQKKKLTFPFSLPIPLFNPLTLAAFNSLYFHRQSRQETLTLQSYDAYFYPLDGLLHWNRIYGLRGFQQYQCLIPPDAARDAMHAIFKAVADSRTGSFLAVLKRCGKLVSPGLLSFPCEGTSLALDFPQIEKKNSPLFHRLDAIVREAHGRMYPAKDAHMTARDFRDAYPRWQELEVMRDPALMSRFWQRTTQS